MLPLLQLRMDTFVSLVFRCCVWCSVHSQPHGGGAEAGGGDPSSSSDRSLPRRPGATAVVRWASDPQRGGESRAAVRRGVKTCAQVVLKRHVSHCVVFSGRRRKHHDSQPHIRPQPCFHGSGLQAHAGGQR